MNEILMQIVINMMHFLCIEDDDIVDLDRAVSELENIAAMLNDLSPTDREIFLRFVEDQVTEHSSDPTQKRYVDFLKTIRTDFFHLE